MDARQEHGDGGGNKDERGDAEPERGAEVCRLVGPAGGRGGYLYVCGSVRMAQDVHAAMVALLVQHDGMTEAEAEAELVAMAARGRYVRDVWY